MKTTTSTMMTSPTTMVTTVTTTFLSDDGYGDTVDEPETPPGRPVLVTPPGSPVMPYRVMNKIMTPAQAYKQVANTVGLKKKKVNEVAEAMMEVSAKQLKSVGAFKIVGALNMTLEQTVARGGIKNTVHVEALRKFENMMIATIPIAD